MVVNVLDLQKPVSVFGLNVAYTFLHLCDTPKIFLSSTFESNSVMTCLYTIEEYIELLKVHVQHVY